MAEETDTNIWDSRFDDDGGVTPADATALLSSANAKASDLLRDVMMIVRNGLVYIPHESLSFQCQLGQGSSFEVNKEVYGISTGEQPYFVAVKRLVSRRETDDPEESARELRAESRRLDNIKREVRVLTHPKLRSHPCIVSAIGWGWMPNTGGSKRPYLVMSCASSGTLSTFAQNRSLNLIERRFLALDVALGIRELHDCNIIHGDVKPDNVLVYDYTRRDEENERHYLAKVADFGSVLFQEDFNQQKAIYLGTPKYNAPEIRGLHRERDENQKKIDLIPLFSRFKAADCYSFGLLLWETVNRGKSFIDLENPIAMLDKMFETKENAILDQATKFFQDWQTNLKALDEKESESRIGVFPSNPTRMEMQSFLNTRRSQLDPIDAPLDEESVQSLKNTVSLCLQDNLWNRGNMYQIVKALAEGLSDLLPLGESSTLRMHPQPRELNSSSPFLNQQVKHLTDESVFFRHMIVGKNLRMLPMDTPADPSLQLARLPPIKQVRTLVLTPQDHHYGSEDAFRASLSRQPLWENQCAAFDFLKHSVNTEKDENRRCQAHLQLAIMYQIGYGVADDTSKALLHLESASEQNEVARAILERVRTALDPNESQEDVREGEPAHVTYRNPDMFFDEVPERIGKADEGFLTLGPIKIHSFPIFSRLVRKGKYKPAQLSDALTDACRDGHLDAALLLAQHCSDIYTINTEKPNPFHWLIMFSPDEAIKVLETIVSSSGETDKEWHMRNIRSLLDAEHDMTVLLPHRCLELRGTPLHWAVMAGYMDLVKGFLRLGADLNKRNQSRRTQDRDGQEQHHPSLSPLDVAVACHFPQIIKLLLDHGSEVYGGDFYWSFSPFHMVGYRTVPFARYMYHGKECRAALRDSIRILCERGLDINSLDSLNQTPIFLAAKNANLEPYILEELLAAGATSGNKPEETEANIVTAAVFCCGIRRFSAWKIPLLLPLVRDINSVRKIEGERIALQYCAFFDAARAAEVLLRCPSIDIDATDASGNSTAISIAGQRGSLEVLALLIANGADIEKGGAMNNAICFGHIEAVRLLLHAGASIHFTLKSGTVTNILQYAVCKGSRRPSYVKDCLNRCPQLREQHVLNEQDISGWTPLHMAAYCGDVEGVRALLDAGADTRKISFVDETPFELATLTLQEFTHPESRQVIRQGHPRIRNAIKTLDGAAHDYGARLRRLEMGLEDCLSEILELLRAAELEQYPEGSDPRPERKIVREPSVGPFVDPEVPIMSRDEFRSLLYSDVRT